MATDDKADNQAREARRQGQGARGQGDRRRGPREPGQGRPEQGRPQAGRREGQGRVQALMSDDSRADDVRKVAEPREGHPDRHGDDGGRRRHPGQPADDPAGDRVRRRPVVPAAPGQPARHLGAGRLPGERGAVVALVVGVDRRHRRGASRHRSGEGLLEPDALGVVRGRARGRGRRAAEGRGRVRGVLGLPGSTVTTLLQARSHEAHRQALRGRARRRRACPRTTPAPPASPPAPGGGHSSETGPSTGRHWSRPGSSPWPSLRGVVSRLVVQRVGLGHGRDALAVGLPLAGDHVAAHAQVAVDVLVLVVTRLRHGPNVARAGRGRNRRVLASRSLGRHLLRHRHFGRILRGRRTADGQGEPGTRGVATVG
nr:hypothetical protein [Angustibacter aerolatus]